MHNWPKQFRKDKKVYNTCTFIHSNNKNFHNRQVQKYIYCLYSRNQEDNLFSHNGFHSKIDPLGTMVIHISPSQISVKMGIHTCYWGDYTIGHLCRSVLGHIYLYLGRCLWDMYKHILLDPKFGHWCNQFVEEDMRSHSKFCCLGIHTTSRLDPNFCHLYKDWKYKKLHWKRFLVDIDKYLNLDSITDRFGIAGLLSTDYSSTRFLSDKDTSVEVNPKFGHGCIVGIWLYPTYNQLCKCRWEFLYQRSSHHCKWLFWCTTFHSKVHLLGRHTAKQKNRILSLKDIFSFFHRKGHSKSSLFRIHTPT